MAVYPGIYINGGSSGGGTGPITGGPGSIQVLDDGVLIVPTAYALNFVNGSTVTMSGTTANIYIPNPEYVNFWNQGANAMVPLAFTTSRYISAPTAEGTPFKINDWTAGTLHPAFNSGTITYTSPGPISFVNTSQTFRVRVLDADGSTIITQRTKSPVNGNSDTTINNIRIIVSGWANDFDHYKATVSVIIDIGTILPNGGRISVYTAQEGAETSIFTDGPFFYDNDVITTLTGLTLSQNTISSNKYLSGIRYYDYGDTFNIGITDIDNVNNQTWQDPLLFVETSNIGMARINVSNSDLGSWTNAWNDANSTYSTINPINQYNFRITGENQRIQATANDWTVILPGISSTPFNYLIDTFLTTSTDILEDFKDENHRLTSSWIPWNSTALLISSDLLVLGDAAQVRFGDWTPMQPLNIANYTTGAAIQYFYRGFKQIGVSHTNGLFYIGGVTELDLSTNQVKLEISLDAINWLDCSIDWDGTLGQLPDGSGCRINSDTINLNNSSPAVQFTLGSGPGGTTLASTGPNGWGIYFRMSMPNTSVVKVDYIELGDWT